MRNNNVTERIREIELELEGKIRNGESRNERRSSEKIPSKVIIPLENKEEYEVNKKTREESKKISLN